MQSLSKQFRFCLISSAMDLSLKDWDVKEQEGLREVEKILDRANEILKVSARF